MFGNTQPVPEDLRASRAVGTLSSDFITIKLPKMIEMDFALQAGVADALTSTCLIRTEAVRLCTATPQLNVSLNFTHA